MAEDKKSFKKAVQSHAGEAKDKLVREATDEVGSERLKDLEEKLDKVLYMTGQQDSQYETLADTISSRLNGHLQSMIEDPKPAIEGLSTQLGEVEAKLATTNMRLQDGIGQITKDLLVLSSNLQDYRVLPKKSEDLMKGITSGIFFNSWSHSRVDIADYVRPILMSRIGKYVVARDPEHYKALKGSELTRETVEKHLDVTGWTDVMSNMPALDLSEETGKRVVFGKHPVMIVSAADFSEIRTIILSRKIFDALSTVIGTFAEVTPVDGDSNVKVVKMRAGMIGQILEVNAGPLKKGYQGEDLLRIGALMGGKYLHSYAEILAGMLTGPVEEFLGTNTTPFGIVLNKLDNVAL